MANILKEIFFKRRLDLADRAKKIPLENIEQKISLLRLKKPFLARQHRFRQALNANCGGKVSVIAEIKTASPSRGVIREDINLGEIIREYERFAEGISVLTEPHRFGGSLERLLEVREQTFLPLLRKDFLSDPYEVAEAAAFGADAILLILAGVSDNEAEKLLVACNRYQLDVLIETHSENDLFRAVSLTPKWHEHVVIGVNNRDLDTLKIDLSFGCSILKRLKELLKVVGQSEIPLVTESGIEKPDDVACFSPNADAVLIGSALMSSSNISESARRIFGRPSPVRKPWIKLCGFTRAADVYASMQVEVDALGFIMVAKSSRAISIEQYVKISNDPILKNFQRELKKKAVAVLENPSDQDLEKVVSIGRFTMVQLHGNETPSRIEEIKQRFGLRIIKAVTPRSVNEAIKTISLPADLILWDGIRPEADQSQGGTGQSWPYELANRIANDRVILAGGLKAENLPFIAATGAWGIDCSSGIEESAGVKSLKKIKRFVELARKFWALNLES